MGIRARDLVEAGGVEALSLETEAVGALNREIEVTAAATNIVGVTTTEASSQRVAADTAQGVTVVTVTRKVGTVMKEVRGAAEAIEVRRVAITVAGVDPTTAGALVGPPKIQYGSKPGKISIDY